MQTYQTIRVAVITGMLFLTSPDVRAESAERPVLQTQDGSDNDMFSNAVGNSELDNVRGASGTTFTAEALGVAILTGVVAHNTVEGANTGNNNITGNAFGDSQGVSFVVQNTGNNSVINAAMVINLTVSQ